jgi:hypothetical protein
VVVLDGAGLVVVLVACVVGVVGTGTVEPGAVVVGPGGGPGEAEPVSAPLEVDVVVGAGAAMEADSSRPAQTGRGTSCRAAPIMSAKLSA